MDSCLIVGGDAKVSVIAKCHDDNDDDDDNDDNDDDADENYYDDLKELGLRP